VASMLEEVAVPALPRPPVTALRDWCAPCRAGVGMANTDLPWAAAAAAAVVVVQVLGCSPVVYDLKNTPFLESLVADLSNADLTRFCRVLAAVVFDRDEVSECTAMLDEIKVLLKAVGGRGTDLGASIIAKPPSVVSRNKDLLNSIPNLTHRLIRLLEANEAVALDLMRSPEFITMMVQIVQHPDHGGGQDEGAGNNAVDRARAASVTLAELAAQIFTPQPGRRVGEPAPDQRGGINARQISQSVYKTEVLFVLSALVGGSDRNALKMELVEAGLTAILRRLLDDMDWVESGPSIAIHGPDCNCMPESGLKVQYLRFVRHFCELSEPKSATPSPKRYVDRCIRCVACF
jgi:hypothetical protein